MGKARVICTIVSGKFDAIFNETAVAMREYADKCDADLRIHPADGMDPRWGPTPHFAKYELFCELAETDYERVLYLDADVYVRKNAPNIFQTYKFTAARSEFPHPRPHTIFAAIDWIREHIHPLWDRDRYYNTGVLLFDDVTLMKLARKLKECVPQQGRFFEQCQLNWLLREVGMPEEQLGLAWNAPIGPNWHNQIPDYSQVYFLHGNAVEKHKKLETLQSMIRKFP